MSILMFIIAILVLGAILSLVLAFYLSEFQARNTDRWAARSAVVIVLLAAVLAADEIVNFAVGA